MILRVLTFMVLFTALVGCKDEEPPSDGAGAGGAGIAAGAGASAAGGGGGGAGASGMPGAGEGGRAGGAAGADGAGRSGSSGAGAAGGAGMGGNGAAGSAGAAGDPNPGPPWTRECTFEQPTECKLCEDQTNCVSLGPNGLEDPSYTDNGDGTVTSSCCGFVWQRDTEWVVDSASPNDNCLDRPGAPGCYDFDEAQAYCASLSLAGGGWRTPTIAELHSLVEWSKPSGPRIDTTAFPNASVADRYWSSSESADNVNEAWRVLFGGTPGGRGPKSREHFVRCIR